MSLFDITPEEYQFLLNVRKGRKEREELIAKGEMLDDGLGSEHSIWCSECKQPTMYVCRPGDFRCSNCEDKEYRQRLIEKSKKLIPQGKLRLNGLTCPDCGAGLNDDLTYIYLTNPHRILAICLECGYNTKRIY